MSKINKIVKTLEEELTNKAEKIKEYDAKMNEIENEK